MRTHRGDDQPIMGFRENSLGPVEDRLEVWRIGDHDDDDVSANNDIDRARHRPRSGDNELGNRGRRPRVDGQREPGQRDPGGHRPAHHAETDEADLERRLRCRAWQR